MVLHSEEHANHAFDDLFRVGSVRFVGVGAADEEGSGEVADAGRHCLEVAAAAPEPA